LPSNGAEARSEDGKALTSATSVAVDVEELRDAVKLKCPSNLANVDAADLTVFENTTQNNTG
jgi:hypothetical protein